MSKKISDLTAATTPLGGTELLEIVQGGVSKKVAASYLGGGSSSVRERLTADRTYYVRSDGSDSNNGMANTSGGAFLTIQKAVDIISADLDMAISSVTVQCNDATRTEAVVLKTYIGANTPTIIGNTTTPANCLMSVTSNHCFTNSSLKPWAINGFKITTATAGYGISCSGPGSSITYSNINFGACAYSHKYTEFGAVMTAATAYTISGGAPSHDEFVDGAVINTAGRAVTLTGTPNFLGAYLYARKGHAMIQSMTFSGSATGSRFNLNLCSTVFSNGASETTFLPGNSAGTKNTGSQWA